MTRITVDVGPLFEPRWTGIPVFTRRLVQALTKHGQIEVDFSYNLTRVPAELVWSAIAAGTGSFMRDAYHRFSYQWEQIEDPSEHLLYPTVKTAIGFSRNEASTIHDMSTLLLPLAERCTRLAEGPFNRRSRSFCACVRTRPPTMTEKT